MAGDVSTRLQSATEPHLPRIQESLEGGNYRPRTPSTLRHRFEPRLLAIRTSRSAATQQFLRITRPCDDTCGCWRTRSTSPKALSAVKCWPVAGLRSVGTGRIMLRISIKYGRPLSSRPPFGRSTSTKRFCRPPHLPWLNHCYWMHGRLREAVCSGSLV